MTEPPTVDSLVNLTTMASKFSMAEEPVVAAAVMEILIILVGTIGNLFTIAAVLRNRNLQYATNYLIVSLAVADFLVTSILVPMRATQHISYQYNRSVPKAFVEVAGFVGRVNIIASISTLVCLSVDRYIALSRPLKYATSIRFNLRKVSIVVATVWILSIFITSMPKFPGVTDVPFLIFFTAFVLVATAVICVMYYYIFKIVVRSLRGKTKGKPIRYSNNFQKKPGNKVRAVSDTAVKESIIEATTPRDVPTKTTPADVPPSTPDSPAAPQFSKEEKKAAKTIGLVITMFILLVYPRIIMILYHFGNDESNTSKVARFWVRVLLYTNSAVNPLFYAYRHKGFRNEFRRMGLQCVGLGRKVRDRYATMRQTQSQTNSAGPVFYT